MKQTIQVKAIAAQSSDGFISRKETAGESSVKWTSPEDTRRFKEFTKQARVVVMGHNTFKTFGAKPLPERLNIVYTRDAVLLSTPWTPELGYTDLSPEVLLETLQNNGYTEVFICGGTQIYDRFRPFMNYLYLTIEPVEFGDGIPLFTDPAAMPSQLIGSAQLDGTRFLTYLFS
jgi:dihydrofolate reductase